MIYLNDEIRSLFLIIISVVGSVNSKADKNYKATCSGSCGRVSVTVSASSGDPDLKVG